MAKFPIFKRSLNLSTSRYWQALLMHYNVDPVIVFKQFRIGAIGFGVGLALIIYANASLEPSAKQELCVLAGLIIGGIGFFIAMMAQIRLMISRFVRFYQK